MFFLHFSDVHFGIERDKNANETGMAVRSNYMNALTERICEINQKRKIDFILLTGDVAWKAAAEDYAAAKIWLDNLLKRCGISADRLFICPGNHDIDRDEVEELEFPKNQKKADKYLRVERLDKLSMRFEQYINFCDELGLQKYTIGSHNSYLVGCRDMGDFRIICLNTAWYAKGDEVKDQMWIGSGFLEVIKKDLLADGDKPNIVIMHHPSTSWHEEERCSFESNTNVFGELCEMADVILCGHTHETNGTNYNSGNALIVSSGALYQEKHYPHCFYLYDIDFNGAPSEQKRIRHYYMNGKWADMSEDILIPRCGKNQKADSEKRKEKRAKLPESTQDESKLRKEAEIADAISSQSNLFCIAGKTLRFVPIICSWNRNEDEYYSGDVVIRTRNKNYRLPDDIYDCFIQKAIPDDEIYDNVVEAKVRIDDYSVKILGGNRPHQLIFNVSKVSYRDFLIVKIVLDKLLSSGTTVRSKYFNHRQSLITQTLPNVCGVGIFIITADNKILISESSKNVAVNPERLIYTASGSMNWNGEKTNPFDDIIRECEEEIGYRPNIENLKLYSFGIDYDSGYYQFSFYEKSDKTADELIGNALMARDFHIEIQRIIPVDFHYKTVLSMMKQTENYWDETAMANLITLVVKNFSKQIVEKYLDPNRKKQNYRRLVTQEWERRAQRDGRFAVLSNRYPALHISQISDEYCQKVLTFIDEDLSEKKVIEVGGGIGLFTRYFAEHAKQITCVDISKGMIQRNKNFLGETLAAKVNYVNCFFQDYQEEVHFDLLICSLVLIHNADELQEIVRNMKRLADTIYLFEHVEDGAQVSRYTEPKTKNEYINLFPEYDVEKSDSYMLCTDNIAFIKLVRNGAVDMEE